MQPASWLASVNASQAQTDSFGSSPKYVASGDSGGCWHSGVTSCGRHAYTATR